MAEAKVEKKVEAPKKKIEVTISSSPYGYYSDWGSLYTTYASKEVLDFLENVSQYGVEKWKIVEYIMEQFLDKDPLEVAKEVVSWDIDMIARWKELMGKGVKK